MIDDKVNQLSAICTKVMPTGTDCKELMLMALLFEPVLWIRIKMCMGLPDPNPSIFLRIQILLSMRKKVRKALISTIFWLLFYFLSLKTDVNVPYLQKLISKIIRKKPYFLLASSPRKKQDPNPWYGSTDQRIRIRTKMAQHWL